MVFGLTSPCGVMRWKLARAAGAHVEPVVLDRRRCAGVAGPAVGGQDLAARHRDHVGDERGAVRRVVRVRVGPQHQLPGGRVRGRLGAPPQAVAGRRVQIAVDRPDPVEPATVQLVAADPRPGAGSAVQPERADAVLVLRGVVRLTGADDHRAVARIGGQRAYGQPRQAAVDLGPAAATVGGAPDTAARGARVESAPGGRESRHPAGHVSPADAEVRPAVDRVVEERPLRDLAPGAALCRERRRRSDRRRQTLRRHGGRRRGCDRGLVQAALPDVRLLVRIAASSLPWRRRTDAAP